MKFIVQPAPLPTPVEEEWIDYMYVIRLQKLIYLKGDGNAGKCTFSTKGMLLSWM